MTCCSPLYWIDRRPDVSTTAVTVTFESSDETSLMALLAACFAARAAAAVFPSDALFRLVERDAVLQQVLQVGFDLLFVDTEGGGELLGMLVEFHRVGIRPRRIKSVAGRPCRVQPSIPV